MKYIIDIPFETDFIVAVRMVDGLPVEVKAEKQEELEPYTEPNHKAIEIQHAHDIENVARLNYNKGTEDAWELARKIALSVPSGGLTINEIKDCYGSDKNFADDVLDALTYKEAKAMYDAWKIKKDEIRDDTLNVYDQVLYRGKKGIITFITEEFCSVMYDDGSTDSWVKIDKVRKTGKSFPQFSELLKQMKGE